MAKYFKFSSFVLRLSFKNLLSTTKPLVVELDENGLKYKNLSLKNSNNSFFLLGIIDFTIWLYIFLSSRYSFSSINLSGLNTEYI